MKLYEHTAKQLFSDYGISVPTGTLLYPGSPIPEELKYPVALKAQVSAGGRGKAGGIKFASNLEELTTGLAELFEMRIHGLKVGSVLVEEKLKIDKEFYLAFLIDRTTRKYLMLASAFGGVEVENIPDENIVRIPISPFTGIQPFMVRRVISKLSLTGTLETEFANIVRSLYKLFIERDAELAEINPLALCENRFVALDAKVIIDDDALYRHRPLPGDTGLTEIEQKAKAEDIAFIQLDGNIGVIANGAGLTMATLDHLTMYGGKAGIFLDLGGTDDPKKVRKAFELMVLAKPTVIFINIFGGITRCDTVANGIREVLEKERIEIPIVARIKGVHDELARQILNEVGIITTDRLEDAAKAAVERAKDGETHDNCQ